MKLFVLTAAAILMLSFAVVPNKSTDKDCSLAITYAELAYKNFKSSNKSGTPDSAATFLKKGIEQADEAAAYAIAEKCNCANAKNYALNAVVFGKKAQNTSDTKEFKKFTKKAMDMSLDVLTAIPGCK